jgi:hypothetical protein
MLHSQEERWLVTMQKLHPKEDDQYCLLTLPFLVREEESLRKVREEESLREVQEEA